MQRRGSSAGMGMMGVGNDGGLGAAVQVLVGTARDYSTSAHACMMSRFCFALCNLQCVLYFPTTGSGSEQTTFYLLLFSQDAILSEEQWNQVGCH